MRVTRFYIFDILWLEPLVRLQLLRPWLFEVELGDERLYCIIKKENN